MKCGKRELEEKKEKQKSTAWFYPFMVMNTEGEATSESAVGSRVWISKKMCIALVRWR